MLKFVLVAAMLVFSPQTAAAACPTPQRTDVGGSGTPILAVAGTIQLAERPAHPKGVPHGLIAVFFDQSSTGRLKEIGRFSDIKSEGFKTELAVGTSRPVNLVVRLLYRDGKFLMAQSGPLCVLQNHADVVLSVSSSVLKEIVFGGGHFGGAGSGGSWAW